MLLTVDIGNTNTHLGWFSGDRLQQVEVIPTKRVASDYVRHLQSSLPRADRVIVASVVPAASKAWLHATIDKGWPKPHFVKAQDNFGISFAGIAHHELGADLFVNAVASRHLFGPDILNVDLGTGSTFCVIKNGVYLGTSIVPGLKVALNALVTGTALLPEVELKKVRPITQTNTVACLQSGIYHGYTALVQGMIKAIKDEQGPLQVVLTGGIGSFLKEELADLVDHMAPDLTLDGLKLIDRLMGGE